jgi:hypothetical protein
MGCPPGKPNRLQPALLVKAFFSVLGLMLACAARWCSAGQPVLSLDVTEPLSAFTPDHPPRIEVTCGAGPQWHGWVRAKLIDLLSDIATVDYLPAETWPDRKTKQVFVPKVPYGVYRLECALVDHRGDIPAGAAGARLTFAYAPAADPHRLADDWPLGAHVTFEDPPLPGFKWYRYFSSWAEDNPARGKYEWSRLDSVFGRVRAIGGRLLIANDTTPAWTAPRRPITRPWVHASTAYPPDDMNDFRAYIDALLERYDDRDGTIGGFEVWNEANTPDRWQGTPEQLVAMAGILREAVTASQMRVLRPSPARVIGIAVSSGDARDYVRGVVRAGILHSVDAVSGHWYEEMLSYDRATPINSLPLHVDLLAQPMRNAGVSLPIWNTESGIPSVARENGEMVPQNELNRRASSLATFDARQPWMLDGTRWREVSERRAAASYVAGTTMLMGLGVEKTFVYSMRDEGWLLDGAPSLSWVALGVFGDRLRSVDFHAVHPVRADVERADPAVRALAYRIGVANQPGLIVAWSYLRDVTVGRPKLWQPWLEPRQVRLEVSAPQVEVSDLYGRQSQRLPVLNKSIVIPVGEEPVYLRELH